MSSIDLSFPIPWLQKVEFPHKLGIMDRLFGRSLARQGTCWVATSTGRTWKLDLANNTHRWIVYGYYEGPGFHRWAAGFLPRDGIIVDSGANIGQMLIYLADLVPAGRIYAFEPGEHAVGWLSECLEENPGLPVELLRVGLGSHPHTALLDDDSASHTHGGQSSVSTNTGTPVKIVRLEDELGGRGLDGINLWKLDVEGYEIPALEGAASWLERQSIRAIYCELHGDNGVRIREYLTGFGYLCHAIDDHGRLSSMESLPVHTNGLFLPRAVGR